MAYGRPHLPPEHPAARSSRGAVLILGASRGLGRATAIAAAEAGFQVMLGCRREADGAAIVHQLNSRGLRAASIVVDVTSYDQVVTAVTAAELFGQGLSGVVNNAGIVGPLLALDASAPTDWVRTIEVNLIGAYHGTRAALSRLVAGGVIVNLSSGAAHRPVAGWSAYCVSKAALAMLTRSTFIEHGELVRVYGAQPGMVDTDMQAEIRAAGVGEPSNVPRRNLSFASLPARAMVWLLQTGPLDLSGTEVDIESAALRERMGHNRTGGQPCE